MGKEAPAAKAAAGKGGPAKGRVRIRPQATEVVGSAKVTNRTANSIEVETAADGTVTVTDCCLEEQGR